MTLLEDINTTPVNVIVSFLKMIDRPVDIKYAIPSKSEVRHLTAPTAQAYLEFHTKIGQDYLWWMRKALSLEALNALLSSSQIEIHVLYVNGIEAGFYELDLSAWPYINLNYFGLLPHAMGCGLGSCLLQHAITTAWKNNIRGLTVNTSTADHPRALPLYKKAGFRKMNEIKEIWYIPKRLGFSIPEHLKVK
jgi:GNAT superfamily N-acetyltransferase